MSSQNYSQFDSQRSDMPPSRPTKRVRGTPKAKRTTTSVSLVPAPKIYFGRQPFPKQLFNTMTYCEIISLNVAAGVAAKQYSCNGIVDPLVGAGGRQPLYFDQLSNIYNHYTVLRSRLKLTWAGSAVQPLLFSMYIEDDTSFPAFGADSIDRITATSKLILPAYGAAQCTLACNWSAKEAFGPSTQADPSMQGNAGSNPTEQQYFTFQIYDPAGAATAGGIVKCEIEYDCVWDELVTVPNSV